MITVLDQDDGKRIDFLTACLLKLGLRGNHGSSTVPSLSRLHLSTASPPQLSELLGQLREIITVHDGEDYIRDENDTFHLEKPSSWGLGALADALPSSHGKETHNVVLQNDRELDYDKIIKRLLVHDNAPPASKETPYFNHDAYYANLKHYFLQERSADTPFGRHILYGDVVTSTNTMLEK